jgi:hypothetical protein
MAPPPPLPSFDGPVWDEPAPADPTAPEPPKRRTALLLGAIIAVIVVATAAFLLFGGDDEPTPSASTTSTPTTDTAAATTTSAVATDPPADPTNLAVAPTGPTTMELTWIDAADNEDRYLVGRVRSEAVDEIADLPANTTSYVVDALEPDTLYCFTVAATNGATGEPHFLPQVCAVTGT